MSKNFVWNGDYSIEFKKKTLFLQKWNSLIICEWIGYDMKLSFESDFSSKNADIDNSFWKKGKC